MAAVSEDAKIRELSELIRNRCALTSSIQVCFSGVFLSTLTSPRDSTLS